MRAAAVLALLLLPATLRAELVYEFRADETGTVMARMALTSLPATHEQIEWLELDDAWGFPSPYPLGNLLTSYEGAFGDIGTGLTSVAGRSPVAIVDDDPPADAWEMAIVFDTGGDSRDHIHIGYRDGSPRAEVGLFGDWVLSVPEPGGWSIGLLPLLALTWRRNR
ncbi:MAG: hypothetical protein KDA60_19890 [Planctomycetales bacterium]|nr:hypothetical protein [Planctomycetales bacterium]